jgi:hypothetical protein
MWRPDFASHLADGWTLDGRAVAHDERSRVRAAGSMDTTIADLARFAAVLVRGDGLRPATHADMVRAQAPITTASQFPSLQDEAPPARRWPTLGTGIGVVTFDGPQGHGYWKAGHDDQTGNIMVCLERRRRCVLLLGNDVRAEGGYQSIVEAILGPTGLPWAWEYPQYAAAAGPTAAR